MNVATGPVPEFVNNSGLEFEDISSEAWRAYEFVTDAGMKFEVKIADPIKLHVCVCGNHRIFDAAGICHELQANWFHLSRCVKPGEAHFSF